MSQKIFRRPLLLKKQKRQYSCACLWQFWCLQHSSIEFYRGRGGGVGGGGWEELQNAEGSCILSFYTKPDKTNDLIF